MLSIQIPDVKDFMNHLLIQDTFHPFYLWEASLKTSIYYHIDGRLNEDFFNSDELENLPQADYISWINVKPQLFALIKGKRTPLSMKLILMLSKANVDNILVKYNLPLSQENINGLFFNIHYDGKTIRATTGVSYKTFTMDKRLEQIFEENMLSWLTRHKITYEKDS